METLIMLRGFLGLGIPESKFTRIITALNRENYYHAHRNVLKEIYFSWGYFSKKQAKKISDNLTQLINEGKFIKNTDYNKVLPYLISKSKVIAESMIDVCFKNKQLPNSKFHGVAIYAFVIMHIIGSWPKLVEEKVKIGELPNEWLTLGKK